MRIAKKTIKQKRNERQDAIAKAPKSSADKTPLQKLVASINTRLGGQGFVHLGKDIQQRDYQRRSSGIPSIDYITCGGYPRGGLVEFGGEFSTGKTSVALEACAYEQRTEGGRVCWIALEPFSKRWARERGFWLPFSEDESVDPVTGAMRGIDPFDAASELEKYRMAQLGIEDPYEERSEFMLIQEERGDVALDAALDAIRSNLFAYVIIDSLGVAKSTAWLEEKEVQDAGDFPREAKMIGDYTTRALLSLNKRYDDNGQECKGGTQVNQTTVIHLNQIVTEIGTQARAKHKTQRIKGGEGNKHNHHCIIFLWKGDLLQEQMPGDRPPYRYAQETKALCLKSKLGPPQLEGAFDFYLQPHGPFQTGDFDVVKDAVGLAITHEVIRRSGAWYTFGEMRTQGRDPMEEAIRADHDLYQALVSELQQAMRR